MRLEEFVFSVQQLHSVRHLTFISLFAVRSNQEARLQIPTHVEGYTAQF